MAEDNQYKLQDIEEIKESNPWLVPFGLSDSEIIAIINLIGQVILGDIDLSEYSQRLNKAIIKIEPIKRQIEIAIAKNRLIHFQDQIEGWENYFKSLGLNMTPQVEKSIPTSFDYQTINNNIDSIPNSLKNSTKMTFSMSDEQEIQSIKTPNQDAQKIDYSEKAKLIIKNFGFLNNDPILLKRLENIIITKLKDVRDDLETFEILTRSRKVGGMEFNDNQANKLLTLINNFNFAPFTSINDIVNTQDTNTKEKIISEQPIKQTPPEIVPKIAIEDGLPVVKLPEDLIVKPELKTIKDLKTEESATEILKKSTENVKINQDNQEITKQTLAQQEIVDNFDNQPITSIKFVSVKDEKSKEINSENQTTETISTDKVIPKPEPSLIDKDLPSVINVKNIDKPTLDGVKLVKPIKSPIDELESMTLIEFRRLADDPIKAVKKIQDIIEIVGQEGINQLHEAINAWHRSEVSKFYRLLGQIAMSEGKNIETVISERLMSGKPTLSITEFEAIMELNKNLLKF